MPGLQSTDIPSKVPSLADTLLCAANPEETPLVTRMSKGRALTQMKHTVFVEVKPSRKTGGATDGQDVTTYEGGGERKEYDVRAQEFRRVPKVGQQAQDIVQDSTTTDQFARLKLRLGKELWKDAETRILSDSISAADEGTEDKGSRMAGLGDRLSTSAQSDSLIPSEVRVPAAQVYSAALSSMTETHLTDIMEARRQACGVSSELVLICGTTVQRKFDDFENYIPDKASHTVTLRTCACGDIEKTLKRGIRFYEGSFGTVEIEIDDFMPNQKRGYLLDFDQLSMLPFGKMVTFNPLPDLGGGPRGLLKATMAYTPGDPRAHATILGS